MIKFKLALYNNQKVNIYFENAKNCKIGTNTYILYGMLPYFIIIKSINHIKSEITRLYYW